MEEGFKSAFKIGSKVSKIAKKGSKFAKKGKKIGGKAFKFAKKNPKKALLGAGAIGVGGVAAVSGVEAGIKGTKFMDEFEDNLEDVGDIAGDAVGAAADVATGGTIFVIGKMLGLDSETIKFIDTYKKHMLAGILALYLYSILGWFGLMVLIIVYLIYKYRDTVIVMKARKQIKTMINAANTQENFIYDKVL